jgi:NADH-quinone oxidoreductase subunit N
MNSTDFIALLPLLLLAGASIVVMLTIAVRRAHLPVLALTLAGLVAAYGALWIADSVAPRQVTLLVVIDRYALFYTGLILAATAAVALLSYGYLEKHDVQREELYVLLLTAALGSAVLVSSSHFVSFFLGLEILSVSLYSLIGYFSERKDSLEAGIKYLILAAASAAFLLFGIALIYADLGTMSFGEIAKLVALPGARYDLLLPGTALVIVGIGFKLAVVPFHLWTPDVYEGAPAPVTAFVATVSKGGMFGLLLRYFYQSGTRIVVIFAIVAIASMFAGNLLALLQNNVKRILAYSSIAHLGYLLVAFLAGGAAGAAAVTFYLVAYFITTLGAFGIVTVLSGADRDADELADYRGLFWERPALAVVFTLMLLSLAGIPLTAGFIGKFFIVAAGVWSGTWALILILVVTSAIGLFYYLRIVVALYSRPAEASSNASLAPAEGVVLAVLAILVVWFGVYPGPLVDLIRAAVAGIG